LAHLESIIYNPWDTTEETEDDDKEENVETVEGISKDESATTTPHHEGEDGKTSKSS